MHLTLKVWRQKNAADAGRFVTYEARDVSEHMSFLEMLDVVNEDLIRARRRADRLRQRLPRGHLRHVRLHDQRRRARTKRATTVCQLHMRFFKDGDTLVARAVARGRASPCSKDLVVDRARASTASSRRAVSSRRTPGARRRPIASRSRRTTPTRAFDAAACIGCGACVAACPNASAMLFMSAKVAHLGLLPQGQSERWRRVRTWSPARRRRLRALQQPRRVRSGLSERYTSGGHLTAEWRFAEVHVPTLAAG